MKRSLVTLALLTAALAHSPTFAGDSTNPNVIVLLTDDQGYGDLSCHGHPLLKTPALDKLHDESTRLTDFHVAPICTPTRSQLLTGRDSLATGAYCVCSGHEFIKPGMPVMPEIFKAAGYRTGLFGKWHLGGNYPYRPQDRGFEDVLYFKGYGVMSAPSHWNGECMDPWLMQNDGRWKQEKGYCTDIYFDRAMDWMKKCAGERKPFMLYLPTNAPHWPYQAPGEFKKPYAKVGPRVAAFYGMIANLDANFARLDAFLKANDLHDNTILVYMTDNGTTEKCTAEVYNAGMRGEKGCYYEGGHRVPCFIRWPGGALAAPGDVSTPTQIQDILPTLLDLCGVDGPRDTTFDGTSLAPLLRDSKAAAALADRMFVVQCSLWDEYAAPVKWSGAVIRDKWRLIHGRELYDIRKDPAQKDDVAAQNPQTVAEMRAFYEQWWSRTEPMSREYHPIHLGSAEEPETMLNSQHWVAPNTSSQCGSVRPGSPNNGPWHIVVEQAGTYEIKLHRWPKEADLPITAAAPQYVSKVAVTRKDREEEFNFYPVGVALPIAKARLKIGDIEASKAVTSTDQAAVFRIQLPAGRTTLQTWFLDAAGKELCGAYYVYCRKLP